MRILITAGGTSEPIDSVRSITNHSSGRLGSEIAAAFLAIPDIEIEYVTTTRAVKPASDPRLHTTLIETTDELLQALQTILTTKTITAVIHSMAVSDFTPRGTFDAAALLAELTERLPLAAADQLEEALTSTFAKLLTQKEEQKISSKSENLLLSLKQTPKIISQIKHWQPATQLIGFKLLVAVEKEELLAVAKASIEKNHASYILANDFTEISDNKHHGYLLAADGSVQEGFTKAELAQLIVAAVQKMEESK